MGDILRVWWAWWAAPVPPHQRQERKKKNKIYDNLCFYSKSFPEVINSGALVLLIRYCSTGARHNFQFNFTLEVWAGGGWGGTALFCVCVS